MQVFFRNGTSVWFQAAKRCVIENGALIVETSRGRTIAEIQIAHLAFWCYDNEELTSYGFAEKADK